MTEALVPYPVVSSLVGWVLTGAVFLAVDVLARKNLATRWLRLLLLGGEPFTEPILMWWNFVVRSRDELDTAYQQWQTDNPRFGRLRSPLARIPAPKPFWSPRA